MAELLLKDAQVLPLRCVLFLTNKFTGQPLAGVPTQLVANFKGKENEPAQRLFIGALATDHVGYCSWDLSPLRRRAVDQIAASQEHAFELGSLTIRLAGPLETEIEALDLSQANGNAFCLRYAADPENLCQFEAGLIPSVQSASILDLTLSPASFSTTPAVMIGQDGCETFLPSNIAPHQYKLVQIIQTPNIFDKVDFRKGPGEPAAAPINGAEFLAGTLGIDAGAALKIQDQEFAQCFTEARLGIAITYTITWYPAGHGLGQLNYSLPLAPAEQVKLAVLDWSRNSRDTRADDQTFSENLDHSLNHDRTVDEVVEATVREWQRGGSIMGSNAFGMGASIGLMNMGGVHGMGGGYTTSSGDRSVSANTSQHVMDQLKQHTTAIRNLRSTIVVTSTQSENAKASTRAIRNYNHSHAMTILYYEVLRHFRVVIEADAGRPVALFKRPLSMFDEAMIFSYRRYLEPALLVPELQKGFDAAEKFAGLAMLPSTKPADPGASTVLDFRIMLHTGGWNNESGGKYSATFDYLGANNQRQTGSVRRPVNFDENLSNPPDMTIQNRVEFILGVPRTTAGADLAIGLRQIQTFSFIVQLNLNQGDEAKTHLGFDGFKVDVRCADGNVHTIVDFPPGMIVEGSQPKVLPLPTLPVAPAPIPISPLDQLSIEEKSLYVRLKSHLNANKAFYWRCIWLAEDPNSRWIANDGAELQLDNKSFPVFNACQNVALEVLGNLTAFELDPNLINRKLPLALPHREEELISVPTRGIFAEAKLGHCNASELIDPERFWDWQKSPIPDDAPNIADVDLASRQAATPLAPATMPGPIAVITQPPAVPDPLATVVAFKALSEPNLFRNMSASKEVADLVKTAIDDATKLASPRPAADPAAKDKKPPVPLTGQNETSDISSPSGVGAQKQTPEQRESERLANLQRTLDIADRLPPTQARPVKQLVSDETSRKSVFTLITLVCEWIGDTIRQPMQATYSGVIRAGLSESGPLEPQRTNTEARWVLQFDYVPNSVTIQAVDVSPFDSKLNVEVPGPVVAGLAVKAGTYDIPLRTQAQQPLTFAHTLQGLQFDAKNPIIHLHGTAKIGKRDVEVTVKIDEHGDFGFDLERALSAEGTIELAKLTGSATLKNAVKAAIGAEQAIKGTFEITYVIGFEVTQIKA